MGVQILPLQFTGCVTLGKFLNLLVYLLPYMELVPSPRGPRSHTCTVRCYSRAGMNSEPVEAHRPFLLLP